MNTHRIPLDNFSAGTYVVNVNDVSLAVLDQPLDPVAVPPQKKPKGAFIYTSGA